MSCLMYLVHCPIQLNHKSWHLFLVLRLLPTAIYHITWKNYNNQLCKAVQRNSNIMLDCWRDKPTTILTLILWLSIHLGGYKDPEQQLHYWPHLLTHPFPPYLCTLYVFIQCDCSLVYKLVIYWYNIILSSLLLILLLYRSYTNVYNVCT